MRFFFNLVKTSGKLIYKNLGTLILFFVLYICFVFLCGFAVTSLIQKLMFLVKGTFYFGAGNMASFLTNPIVILLYAVRYVIIAGIGFFEITGLIYIFHMSNNNKKTNFFSVIGAACSSCKRAIHIKNWQIVVFTIVLFPLTGIFPIFSFFTGAYLPNFVFNSITTNKLVAVGLVLLFVYLVYLLTQRIFAFNIYTLEGCSFISASGKSKRYTRKRIKRTLFSMLSFSIIIAVLVLGLSVIIPEILSRIYPVFASQKTVEILNFRTVEFSALLSGFLLATVLPIVNLALVSSMYYSYRNEMEDETPFIPIVNDSLGITRPSAIFMIVVLGFSLVYSLVMQKGIIREFWIEKKPPQIVAHRGDSAHAPENTHPAFGLAVNENVDLIELDVRETKDGVVVVSHDDNQKNKIGRNFFIHENTYEDVLKLDLGKWFSNDFENLRISTLEEILAEFKDTDIEFQIELKSTKFDKDLEKKTIDLIYKYGMENRCYIVSLDKETLLKVKEFNPDIKTVFAMNVASGDVQKIPGVDHLSLEYSNVNEELVNQIHAAGKKVYTWTVNSDRDVQYLIDCGVDGILGDDPFMLKNAIEKADYSAGFARILRKFVYIFSRREFVSGLLG